MHRVVELAKTKAPMLHSWLMRPLYVSKELLFGCFALCLAILAVAPFPPEGMSAVFFAAVCFGVSAAAALIFSTDAISTSSKITAFFVALVMHGLVTGFSILGGYYPQALAGGYYGQAVRNSALFVLLEWGGIIALGPLYSDGKRPAFPRWALASLLLIPVVVVIGSQIQVGNYWVVSGERPVKYWRFSEPFEYAPGVFRISEHSEYQVALVDDVFVMIQSGWSDRLSEKSSTLKVWDIKNEKRWTMDVVPSDYWLSTSFLALGKDGGLLVVHRTGNIVNESGDEACWVTGVDLRSATANQPEYVDKFPWLDSDTGTVLLQPEWQKPPFSTMSRIEIAMDKESGLLFVRGPGFRWNLLSDDPGTMVFLVGEDVVVVRHVYEGRYEYQVFLLP
jgi:hypothetical protein